MVRTAISAALLLGLVFVSAVWDGTRGDDFSDPPAGGESPRTSSSDAETALPDETTPEFERAGVCARCHVISVLEWGVSAHLGEDVDCQECHGPSEGHVANERNEVKPDRIPRKEAIAKQLCMNCHETGCPETSEVQSCQKCHHVHALINPSKPPAAEDDRLTELLKRWDRFQAKMADGDKWVQREDWKAAQAAYREALDLMPGNHLARMRVTMCGRRLHPSLPSFEIAGDGIDAETGLPREVRVVGTGTEMLLVPSGQFDLGSDELAGAGPVHTVRVDALYLGRYEVTQAEWVSVMGDNPSTHQGDGFSNADRMPVEHVSWDDCQEFLRRLNQRIAGGGFRLPTEAEWEYACRCGSRGAAAGDALSERAWHRANSVREAKSNGPFRRVDAYAPRPVGTRRPNAWGFHDMQGNVSEWCSDPWRPYLHRAASGDEPLTRPTMRVLRGGGFADSAASLDPAFRHPERPHRRLRWNGLRLARTVPGAGEK